MLQIISLIPHYSTLSRRSATLEIPLENRHENEPINIAIDATGLKVYGEGEWKMRTHGKDKRRTWRKFHIAINHETHEIVATDLTESNVHDSLKTRHLLDETSTKHQIASVAADKGYDNKHGYQPIADHGARAIIPPRSGAALKTKNITFGDVERNRIISENWFLGKNE